LRGICEAIMMDAMYEIPSSKEKDFKVTLQYAKDKFSHSKLSQLKVA
jgi:ATP-dependent Clp protease ATP-binding subunit ClpX